LLTSTASVRSTKDSNESTEPLPVASRFLAKEAKCGRSTAQKIIKELETHRASKNLELKKHDSLIA
jgi:hypothetical protein